MSHTLLPWILAVPPLFAIACKLYVTLTTVYTDESVSMKNKVVIVTGSNTGIGLYTARALVKSGAHVIIAVRSVDKGNKAKQDIEQDCRDTNKSANGGQITVLKLDLSNLDSVVQFVENFKKLNLPLNVLINNAGMATMTNNVEEATTGVEPMFATNHLGHYLLTKKLLPLLKQSNTEQDPGRVVIVASGAHEMVSELTSDNLERHTKLPLLKKSAIKTASVLKQYGFTKLCNIYHAQHLTNTLKEEGTKNVVVVSLHPGAIKSDMDREVYEWPLWKRIFVVPFYLLLQFMFFKSTQAGAQTSIFAAASPKALAYNGLYLDDLKPRETGHYAKDKSLQQQLIGVSEKLIEDYQ